MIKEKKIFEGALVHKVGLLRTCLTFEEWVRNWENGLQEYIATKEKKKKKSKLSMVQSKLEDNK